MQNTTILVVTLVSNLLSVDIENEWRNIQTKEASVNGYISYYDEGLMERVAVNRGYIDSRNEYSAWLKENGYIGAISGMRYADIGRVVYIGMGGETTGPYIIIDCSGRDDYFRNVFILGRIGEVSKRVAKSYNMNEPLPATIIYDETVGKRMAERYENEVYSSILH